MAIFCTTLSLSWANKPQNCNSDGCSAGSGNYNNQAVGGLEYGAGSSRGSNYHHGNYSQGPGCSIYSFTIDFEKESDWMNIIWPPRAECTMCYGDCCHPTKTKSINVLYQDHNKNVLMGIFPNCKVEECVCVLEGKSVEECGCVSGEKYNKPFDPFEYEM